MEALSVDVYDQFDNALDGLMSHYVQGDNSVSHEHATFAAATAMCNLLTEDVMEGFKDQIRKFAGTSSIVIFARCGRICRVPSEVNAYRFRTQRFEPMFNTTWSDDKDREVGLDDGLL